MADLCTPILVTIALANLCFAQPSCEPATDGQHSICSLQVCKPPPTQYNCVRADGAHYIWQPDELPAIDVDPSR